MYLAKSMLGAKNYWKPFLEVKANLRGRDFVCGDIHGCFDDLEYLLRRHQFDTSKDRLFCVGDLIDRGPRSKDALEYFRKDWLWSVLGNHEQMFYEIFQHLGSRYAQYNYENGSDWSRKQPSEYLEALAREVEKLPLIIKIGADVIVHAALPQVESFTVIEKAPERYLETILWHRGKTLEPRIPGITRVYCGHTIVNRAGEQGRVINLDTGCFIKYYGSPGVLTLREL